MWLFYENGWIQQIFVSTVDTMLWHQSISGHSAEYGCTHVFWAVYGLSSIGEKVDVLSIAVCSCKKTLQMIQFGLWHLLSIYLTSSLLWTFEMFTISKVHDYSQVLYIYVYIFVFNTCCFKCESLEYISSKMVQVSSNKHILFWVPIIL